MKQMRSCRTRVAMFSGRRSDSIYTQNLIGFRWSVRFWYDHQGD